MCQLCLVNTRNTKLNQILLSCLLQTDSTGNRDGTGFLYVNKDNVGIWKTELAGSEIADLGMNISSLVVSTYPVMGHVRAASKGIEVTRENAHPFGMKRFYLTHNGRLYGKDEIVRWSNSTNDNTGIASDSLVFLQALEKNGNKDASMPFVDLINLTMSEFKGKFALMVYDSMYDKHYVIRGSSADLYMAKIYKSAGGDELTQIGCVVNTKKTSLEDVLVVFTQIAQIQTKTLISISEITELEKEAIYEVTSNDLVKIGDIKENEVKYTYATTPVVNPKASSFDDLNIPIIKYGNMIATYAQKNFLTYHDIDAMFYIYIGVSMADVTIGDIRKFCTDVIQKNSAKKTIRKKMDKVLGKYGKVYPIYYSKIPGLEYPWTINDDATINKLIVFLEDQMKKSAG